MSGDSAFFEELQMDFLNESAFMLEQYEEYMMKLENSEDPAKDLTDIFRVAHSVKGGAAAVGLTELSKFAHVMEDLLDLLRSKPELVNSNVISLLLTSGDELKNRVGSLQKGSQEAWNPAELKVQLIAITEELSGKKSKHQIKEAALTTTTEEKIAAPDDFFSNITTTEVAMMPTAENLDAGEDFTNHELLAELLSQLSPEEQAEFHAEEAKKQAPLSDTVVEVAAATHVPAAVVETPVIKPNLELVTSAPVKSSSGNGGGPSNKAPGKPEKGAIKVDTSRVDSVLDAVGELVVLKNQLVHDETVKSGQHLRLEAMVDQLDKAVRELYEKTLSIRMTPLKSMFIKIQRIVRDVSISLDKPVDLKLIGEETEVERTVFEILGDPLVHLVRNSMDHGVEKKELRQERGKSATAHVSVHAKQSGGNVIIEIADDGGGINRDKVLKKAIEKGLVPTNVDPAQIPDEQVYQYILQPGFSTADKISDLSGRGVGLDVVKSNLDKINGQIHIFSKPGLGSTFRLTIPLSTAITDGIIVALEGARYILPIHSIREIVRVLPKDYTQISSGAGKVASIRGSLIPVIDVAHTLGLINGTMKAAAERPTTGQSSNHRREETMLVIIESMNGQMAFPVDDVLGQAQVVVKPISTGYNIPEVAGAAILGDGKTVLILDPANLVQTASKSKGVA